MRALAATWVVLFHFRGSFESLAPWLAIADPVWQAGYLGVDLFFPLSGFVLAYNYADRLSSWSWHGAMAFWQNRIARVSPVHIATLHIDLVMSLVTGRMGITEGGHRRTLTAYLQNLAMVQNWFNDRPSYNGPVDRQRMVRLPLRARPLPRHRRHPAGLRLDRLVWPLAIGLLAVIWLVPDTHSPGYWLAPGFGLFVAAWLLHVAVERPCRDLLRARRS